MLKTKLITAPILTAVTLDEMKDHLRVTGADEDGVIVAKMKAATAYIENYTGMRLMTQTWDWYMDEFPTLTDIIFVPYAPLQSVTHLKYYNSSDVLTTLSATTDYRVDVYGIPGRIQYINSWPSVYDKVSAVTIRFVCGYSDTDEVPEDLKDGLKLLAAHLYENRQQVMTSHGSIGMAELPFGFKELIDHYVLFDQDYK